MPCEGAARLRAGAVYGAHAGQELDWFHVEMMNIWEGVKLVSGVAVRRKMTGVFYIYCGQRQGGGRKDKEVRCYDASHPLPLDILRQLKCATTWTGLCVMRRRLKRGHARLLCLLRGGRLCAYGWVQQWGPFRRRLGWLTLDAVMLGPYWTAPSERGKGLYGRLLAHSIAVCPERDRKPLLIFARPGNWASLRGIEKAGFLRLGVYEVTSWLCHLVNRPRTIQQERSLGEVLAACRGDVSEGR